MWILTEEGRLVNLAMVENIQPREIDVVAWIAGYDGSTNLAYCQDKRQAERIVQAIAESIGDGCSIAYMDQIKVRAELMVS